LPLPELEGQAGQQRLMQAIIDLFRDQKQPVVLILEDLQWADESLDVLRKLIPLTEAMPLLILGDYRNDERPGAITAMMNDQDYPKNYPVHNPSDWND